MSHIPQAIYMLRPLHFSSNEETLDSNHFQSPNDDKGINIRALSEFDNMHKKLLENGVKVYLLQDTDKDVLPDAVFLNNWFSVQPDQSLFLYPMLKESRQREVRDEHIATIKNIEHTRKTIDWREQFTEESCEGTGSIVFDHHRKALFASISVRTDTNLVEAIAVNLGYRSFIFESFDKMGQPIYHTNVMMSVGKNEVVICLDSIENLIERKILVSYFQEHSLKIIDISLEQMYSYCGNIFEVDREDKSPVWIMSSSSYKKFTPQQIDALSQNNEIIQVFIETFEKYGGGGSRCMMAGSYL